jgi:hypothetical protein
MREASPIFRRSEYRRPSAPLKSAMSRLAPVRLASDVILGAGCRAQCQRNLMREGDDADFVADQIGWLGDILSDCARLNRNSLRETKSSARSAHWVLGCE